MAVFEALLMLIGILAGFGFIYLIGSAVCRRTNIGQYGAMGKIFGFIIGLVAISLPGVLIVISPPLGLAAFFAASVLGIYGLYRWHKNHQETGHW